MNEQLLWEKEGGWRFVVGTAVLPNGHTSQYAQVRHPGAVVLLPLTADNHVLMLRQYRVALGQTIWELPAGTRGWEEPWEECAQRELREETGYSAGEFISLGEIWPIPGSSDELMRLYLVRELTPAPLPPR